MELLLLHLALDKIGVQYEWSAELCSCTHGVPPLAQPAWSMYEVVLGPIAIATAYHNLRKES